MQFHVMRANKRQDGDHQDLPNRALVFKSHRTVLTEAHHYRQREGSADYPDLTYQQKKSSAWDVKVKNANHFAYLFYFLFLSGKAPKVLPVAIHNQFSITRTSRDAQVGIRFCRNQDAPVEDRGAIQGHSPGRHKMTIPSSRRICQVGGSKP